jgi:hypothetical protein
MHAEESKKGIPSLSRHRNIEVRGEDVPQWRAEQGSLTPAGVSQRPQVSHAPSNPDSPVAVHFRTLKQQLFISSKIRAEQSRISKQPTGNLEPAVSPNFASKYNEKSSALKGNARTYSTIFSLVIKMNATS